MRIFMQSFLAALHIWMYTLFPVLTPLREARANVRIEVTGDETVDVSGNPLVQSYYVTVREGEGPLNRIDHALFVRGNQDAGFLRVWAGGTDTEEGLQDGSQEDRSSVFQESFSYALDSQGVLCVTVPEDFSDALEILGVSRFRLQRGQDILEVGGIVMPPESSSPFCIEKKALGPWILRSMPPYVDTFRLRSSEDWVNQSTWESTQSSQIHTRRFHNQGRLVWHKGGILDTETFENQGGAIFKTSGSLKITPSVEALNQGFLEVGGDLSLQGKTFNNRGTLHVSGSFNSTLATFVNGGHVQSFGDVRFMGSGLTLEKGSVFNAEGAVDITVETWKQSGFLKGEGVRFSVGPQQKIFTNEGIIQAQKAIKGRTQGFLRNAKKTQSASGGEFLVEGGSLELVSGVAIQNFHLMAALQEICLEAPVRLESSGSLWTKALRGVSQGPVRVVQSFEEKDFPQIQALSESLGEAPKHRFLGHVVLKGKTVEVPSLKTTETMTLVAQESLTVSSVISERGGVILKGDRVFSQDIQGYGDIVLKGVSSLTLQGLVESMQGEIRLKAPVIQDSEATFHGDQGVTWETPGYKRQKTSQATVLCFKDWEASQGPSQVSGKALQPQNIENLKQFLGKGSPQETLTLQLPCGLVIDRPFSYAGSLVLEIPEASSQGLRIESTLETGGDLFLRTPFHALFLGFEEPVGDLTRTVLGCLKSKGHLRVEALSMKAPVAKIYGGRGVTIETKDTFQLGGFLKQIIRVPVIYPIVSIQKDSNGTVRGAHVASTPEEAVEAPGKITNGSYVVSQGPLNLSCGALDFSCATIKTNSNPDLALLGTLCLETTQGFKNFGSSFFIEGGAQVQSHNITFTAELGSTTFQRRLGGFFFNAPRGDVIMTGTVPYVVSPVPSFHVLGGDLVLKVSASSTLFANTLSASGRFITEGPLTLETVLLKPTYSFASVVPFTTVVKFLIYLYKSIKLFLICFSCI